MNVLVGIGIQRLPKISAVQQRQVRKLITAMIEKQQFLPNIIHKYISFTAVYLPERVV